jgi:hypothetical protein
MNQSGPIPGLHGTGMVFVEDPDGLLSFEKHGNEVNITIGKEGKIHVPKIELEISDPDSSQWVELEEKKVILSDKELRIKIKIAPKLDSLSDIFNVLGTELSIKTSGTAPSGHVFALNAQTAELVQQSSWSELRVVRTRDQLRSLGVLPLSENDPVEEKAWLDTGVPDLSAASNLSDGLAFDALPFESRGRCTSDGNLHSEPPNSPIDKTFFQAAGREIITVRYGGATSPRHQIMNQADVFYYSGHGYHSTGALACGEPSQVQSYWNQDLKCAVFAGCSVLDINDYNRRWRFDLLEHIASPGKHWELVGPAVMLGYNYKAPLDTQGAAEIITRWITDRSVMGDVGAWMNANDRPTGHNACAIVKGLRYYYFKRIRPLNPRQPTTYMLTVVEAGEW